MSEEEYKEKIKKNLALLGKFKDETSVSEIQEFVWMKGIIYSIVGDGIKARAQQSAILSSK